MNSLCVIPARGRSKRLKNKNILNIHGKPLIGYTIEPALASKLVDRVVVSTDSKKITEVVKSIYRVDVIKRPSEFSKDDSPIEEALLHAVEYLKQKEGYSADIIIWLQANVPIRKKGIIDKAIKKIKESDADSCVTCYRIDQLPELMKIIDKKGMLKPVYKNVSSIRYQEFPKRYLLDGSVVVLKTANLYNNSGIRKAHIYLGKKVIPIVQEKKIYSLEIHTADDLFLLKYYLDRVQR